MLTGLAAVSAETLHQLQPAPLSRDSVLTLMECTDTRIAIRKCFSPFSFVTALPSSPESSLFGFAARATSSDPASGMFSPILMDCNHMGNFGKYYVTILSYVDKRFEVSEGVRKSSLTIA